jgi:hypothetical protein
MTLINTSETNCARSSANKAAVLEKLPSAAAYLNHLDDSQEELDATRFGSVEMEKYVELSESKTRRAERESTSWKSFRVASLRRNCSPKRHTTR